MNANALAVVLVSLLVCGVVGGSATPQSGSTTTASTPPETAEPSADASLGGEISVFMQRGVAAANGSVDSGMWLAGFERVENQTRKETLVAQRAAVLDARLDRLASRIRGFSPSATNRSVAHRAWRARLVADLDALRTSVSEAKTAAAGDGVNASALDRLSRRAEALAVPRATSNGTRTTTGTPDDTPVGTARRASPTANASTDGRRTAGTTREGL